MSIADSAGGSDVGLSEIKSLKGEWGRFVVGDFPWQSGETSADDIHAVMFDGESQINYDALKAISIPEPTTLVLLVTAGLLLLVRRIPVW